MKINFSYLLIALLLGCNNSNPEIISNNKEEQSACDNYKDQLIYFINLENDTLINTFLYGKSNEDSISLINYFKKKESRLVLFITPNSCMSCIDDLFYYLNDSINSRVQEFLTIISTGESYRSLYLLTRKYDLDVPILLAKTNTLGINEFMFSGPMFFLINESLVINMVLYAYRLEFFYLNKYLTQILNRFLI